VLHDDDAGHTRGSAVSTASSACVPPVDVPMATMRSVVWIIAPRSPAPPAG
jgi:hypothetical protein